MNLEQYSGVGNRFLLMEASGEFPGAPELARRWCVAGELDEQGFDGLLVVSENPPGNIRMVIWNADGSRPEACGNGLRCVGWHLVRTRGGREFLIETDSGQRRVRLVRQRDTIAELYTDMGPVDVAPLDPPWPTLPGLLSAYRAGVGNPHGTLLLEDERGIDGAQISAQLRVHSQFPSGVNVGLLARRTGKWFLRVHERGVGETAACGTGACAAVAVLAQGGHVDPLHETAIQMPGGILRVRLGESGRAELLGAATYEGPVEPQPKSFGEGSWATYYRS
jgi:diaminopimelate epimerase